MSDILKQFPRCARLVVEKLIRKMSDTLKKCPRRARLFVKKVLRKMIYILKFVRAARAYLFRNYFVKSQHFEYIQYIKFSI